jgi:hypothetical protein
MLSVQLWTAVAVAMIGYILGFYFQHRDLEKLDGSLNRRIDDLRDTMNSRFADMKDFIKSEISRLEDRIDRLERPVARP